MKADKTAIIGKGADIADNVEIGPYTIVEEGVRIASGCKLAAGVHIYTGTEIGPNCTMHRGAALGNEPQDIAYTGQETFLKIGSGKRNRGAWVNGKPTVSKTVTAGSIPAAPAIFDLMDDAV